MFGRPTILTKISETTAGGSVVSIPSFKDFAPNSASRHGLVGHHFGKCIHHPGVVLQSGRMMHVANVRL
jgi:hypothetical protein